MNHNITDRKRSPSGTPRFQRLPERLTKAIRTLSSHGAMAPEGCERDILATVMQSKRLTPKVIKRLLSLLWKARLLHWLPSDVEYLEFNQLEEMVANRTKRPIDTGQLIRPRFRNLSPMELMDYRFGTVTKVVSH